MAESGEDGVHGQEQKLKGLKFLRRGKKAAITIRIQKLEKLIGEMGSQRMVRRIAYCSAKSIRRASRGML